MSVTLRSPAAGDSSHERASASESELQCGGASCRTAAERGSGMSDLVERLFALWRDTPADDESALAAFRALYTDPVPVNGAPMTAAELLARARAIGTALDGLEIEVLDEFETPGRLVVVHRMRGRHTGPLPTPLGP